MVLADEYRRQLRWRDWQTVLDALPPLRDRSVLDLGCGVGDVAALLVARGARVEGLDANDELLDAARGLDLAGASFRHADLRRLPPPAPGAPLFDGIWCSFVAAYFVDLGRALTAWALHLRPGGWIAVTEIDDLFGHEPVAAHTRELLDGYAHDALAAGRYDFRMGRKLRGHLERCGFEITRELTLRDDELAFDGPAASEVLDAWSSRLEHMTLLHSFCGPAFPALHDDLLACLARPDHRSIAAVRCCIATRRR